MGGGITFSPNNLCNIPLPIISCEAKEKLLMMADKHASHFSEEDQDELDTFVYSLYKLDENDIAILEKFKIKTKRRR